MEQRKIGMQNICHRCTHSEPLSRVLRPDYQQVASLSNFTHVQVKNTDWEFVVLSTFMRKNYVTAEVLYRESTYQIMQNTKNQW